jgi:hypothetical protein
LLVERFTSLLDPTVGRVCFVDDLPGRHESM